MAYDVSIAGNRWHTHQSNSKAPGIWPSITPRPAFRGPCCFSVRSPPLLRGHYAVGYVIGAWQLVTLGLSNIIFAFIYNRLFILHIMDEGLKASGASHDLNHLSVRLKFRIPELEKTQPENTRMQRYPLPKQRPGARAV